MTEFASARIQPAPGWPGYFVSASGFILSEKGAELRAMYHGVRPGQAYVSARLTRDGRRKWVAVHALVALAFHGPRPEGAIIRHLNDDRFDNRAENLRYGTLSENSADAKANGKQARGAKHVGRALALSIREQHRQGRSIRQLAIAYGRDDSTIRGIVTGRTYQSNDSAREVMQ